MITDIGPLVSGNMGVVWCLLAMLLLGVDGTIDPCERHKTCRECIRDPKVCAWCDSINLTGCKSAVATNWCPTQLQNNQNEINVASLKEFNIDIGSVTQVKPQGYKLKMRAGMPAPIEFSFEGAPNYPLDLYFLLDASKTMFMSRTKIRTQSKAIYNRVSKLTNKVRMGMGTFIDKNTLPYTANINSELTYSFKNRLSLTNDSDEFIRVVQDIPFGDNRDEPEGGLDALAQVISCKKEIGWREESRKIIIFFTDGPYHAAGDGKQAGIFKPHDRKCHLNDNGTYTMEVEMDYPSVSLINKMVADEGIAIIFAVKNTKKEMYSFLSKAIGGSKYNDYSSSLTTMIKDLYNEITNTIKIKVNFRTGQREYFHLTFDPDCTTDNDECEVKIGQEKRFTANITLLEYFGEETTKIDLMIVGIKETITLEIDIINKCDCELHGTPNASECSNAGTLECGQCICNPKRQGDKCACTTNSISNVIGNSTCIVPGDDDECSGHGICVCGNCICRFDSPYEGKYCQFNKDNCPRHDNIICNGHGRCEGEKCICDDLNWSGDACACPTWKAPCLGPNGKICSVLGECKCGKCVCNKPSAWDARTNLDNFCNILACPDCHTSQCNILESCARCVQSGTSFCPECADGVLANTTANLISPANISWNICPDTRVDVGCYIRYMYKYDDENYNIQIVVKVDKNCQESYYMFGGIFLISVFLIGVATLIGWKLLTYASDKREYEKFIDMQKELTTAPCDNPTYRPASTTVENPAFRNNSVST